MAWVDEEDGPLQGPDFLVRGADGLTLMDETLEKMTPARETATGTFWWSEWLTTQPAKNRMAFKTMEKDWLEFCKRRMRCVSLN